MRINKNMFVVVGMIFFFGFGYLILRSIEKVQSCAIPGQRGPPGQRGEDGCTGPAGPKGQRGPRGLRGTKGRCGRTGEKGDKGENGSSGNGGQPWLVSSSSLTLNECDFLRFD